MSSRLSATLVTSLQQVVGTQHVLTDPARTEPFRTGYRFGSGKALAVVQPGTLLEYWRVLQVCVAGDAIIISQAANTGLTGGSTPSGDDYERDIVIINTLRMDGIQLLNRAEQVVCLPGSTLNALEVLLKKHGREPHSVIGSSCIGASVIGGICNNSGGALVQRGPAYTEMALYAQLDASGELQLVNHLGIALGDTPEEILTNLQEGRYTPRDVLLGCGKGHDHAYCHHVRQVDADTPARFNADPARHYEASGSAGRLGVFAVRLDTFPLEKQTAVFYIGTNDTHVLNDLRRHMLAHFQSLPISGEYIHRDAFDIAAVYGKDTFWVIKKLGTHRLPALFAFKARVDRLAKKLPFLPAHFADKALQVFARLLPQHLPQRLRDWRDRYEHHLILKMGGEGVEEARQYLTAYFGTAPGTAGTGTGTGTGAAAGTGAHHAAEHEAPVSDPPKHHTEAHDAAGVSPPVRNMTPPPAGRGGWFECNTTETQAAMLHRFAVASAAVRYRAVHDDTVEEILALDVALRRNDPDWFEQLPASIDSRISHKLYYGHFMCHVFHQDYIVRKGNDWMALEADMLKLLDDRGAQYPAEHNVGHLYHAKPSLQRFYRQLDPTNSFNPGIGHTSKKKHWA